MLRSDQPPDSRLLRRALKGNAAFSGACAVLLLAAPDAVGFWLGLPGTHLLVWLGLGLLAFAGALVVLAMRPWPSLPWVRAIIAADASWVVGTVILLLTPWVGALSRRGVWTVILVAVVVAFWGVLQVLGVRAMGGRGGQAPP